MARINKYPIDPDPSKSDLLLGSDQGGATRNYTLDVVGKSLSYFNNLGFPMVAYWFDAKMTGGRQKGTLSFATASNDEVAFNGLTSIIASKYNYGDTVNTRVNLIDSWVSTEITITSIEDPNRFGIYSLDTLTNLAGDSNFYTLAITYKGGNGSLIKDQFYTITSKKTDLNYTHYQASAATTWSINHNLGKNPSVTIVAATGDQVQGEVEYIDANNVTVTLSSANSGKAYLN